MEVWKDVVGYEGLYQVSNLGNVRGVTRTRYVNEKRRGRQYKTALVGTVKKPKMWGSYLNVNLSKNGSKKSFSIHRLVATAFVPNPNGYNEINHKDENKLNNCADNLEWVTHKQNMNYGTLPQRRAKIKAFKRQILQCDREGNVLAEYVSIVEASNLTGINKNSIYNGLSRNGYCKGFYWKYKDNRKKRRKDGGEEL